FVVGDPLDGFEPPQATRQLQVIGARPGGDHLVALRGEAGNDVLVAPEHPAQREEHDPHRRGGYFDQAIADRAASESPSAPVDQSTRKRKPGFEASRYLRAWLDPGEM